MTTEPKPLLDELAAVAEKVLASIDAGHWVAAPGVRGAEKQTELLRDALARYDAERAKV